MLLLALGVGVAACGDPEEGDTEEATEQAAAVANLLVNGDFETSEGWTTGFFRGTGVAERSTADKHGGRYSYKLKGDNNNSSGQVFSAGPNRVAVQAGKSYTYQAWYKGSNAYLVIKWFDRNGAQLQVSNFALPSTTSWKQATMTDTAPPNATQAWVFVQTRLYGGATYFDDLTFSGEGSTPPPPPPPPPPSTGPQCSGAKPPPAAASAGLTKLAFCDDFSDPRTFDFKGTGNPGFKWYRNYWFNFSQNTRPDQGEPESSFKMANGVLELRTQKAHYQSNMQSAILKNGKPVGFYIDRQTAGWYVEAALAHPASANGVGFWSMDMCHIYGYPRKCQLFVEPDWYEYWSGGETRSTHLWSLASGTHKHVEPDCGNWFKNGLDPNQFRTYGALTTSAGVTYWRDNAKVRACDTMPWKNHVVAGPPALGSDVGRYPLLIGTQPGHSVRVDFVRVWVKP